MMVLAHRGGSGYHRENTLAAFAQALSLGADGIELDVRQSADGVAVVHHDPELDGISLRCLDAAALPEWVPTIEEAMATCSAAALLDIEVKTSPEDPAGEDSEPLARAVADLVNARRRHGKGPEQVLVTSFGRKTLLAVRDAVPDIPIGLLVPPSAEVAGGLTQAISLGAAVFLPHFSQLSPRLVEEAHGRGLAVFAWTVNDAAEILAAEAGGVDAIITDDVPEALKLRSASQSPA